MFGLWSVIEWPASVGDRTTANWYIIQTDYRFLWFKWSSWQWNVCYYKTNVLKPYATFTGVKRTYAAAVAAITFLMQDRW